MEEASPGSDPFSIGKWVRPPAQSQNAFALFTNTFTPPPGEKLLRVRVTASHHYELFINGGFVARGPVHGDPRWSQYDDFEYRIGSPGECLEAVFLLHHSDNIHLQYLTPSPPGLRAELEAGELRVGTNEDWSCLPLEMWAQDVPKRGPVLDYFEDYDARLEPGGWQEKRFSQEEVATWPKAVLVEDAPAIWSGYSRRMTPMLRRRWLNSAGFAAFRAPGSGAKEIGQASRYSDEEELLPVRPGGRFDLNELNRLLHAGEANALTFDLERERVGFYAFELEAPEGTIVEISGAELLQESGRPWIFRKNVSYTARYRCREGRQSFSPFFWSGFRYLHLVVRGDARDVRLHRIGCVERRVPLPPAPPCPSKDHRLKQIFELCRYTLEVGVQEHLIDCPTREQGQYWGDAVFIAQSLWRGFGEESYLRWYLECFLHVPFKENEQITSTYPGDHVALLDYSLIPLIGQRIYRGNTGHFYRPKETLAKGLRVKEWYDAHLDETGLVTFDYETYAAKGMRTFIDHPGLGWHNFPHRGIDRHGTNCALNLFFFGFLETLSEIARSASDRRAEALQEQADRLGRTIVREFFDGRAFHDAREAGLISEGTSWQTNSLAVYFDLVRGEQARDLMEVMLEGYDHLCRCSPYFYFYLLPVLRKVGLEAEALDLIKKEWTPMLERGATTTWEGFAGDEKDTLCHPWSTAPFLFLLEGVEE